MKDNFDANIKNCINNNLNNLDIPQDIFENAWNENLKLKNKEKYIMKKDINKFITAAALCITVLGGALFSSPVARAAVKSFFDLDINGNIVEKSGTDTTHVNCSIKLTDKNKKYLEKLLGFEITQPDSIGDYVKATTNPVPGLHIKNVKFKDEKKITDEINKSTNYEITVNNLKKNYDVKASLLSMYLVPAKDDVNEIKIFSVAQSKTPYKDSIEKTIKINDIPCNICSKKLPNYSKKVNHDSNGFINGIETIDTIKPDGTTISKSISFSYNGIYYNIYGDDLSTVNSETLKFAEEYIKYLKSNN